MLYKIINKFRKSNKGSAVFEIIVFTGVVVFLILPLFTIVIERYILYYKVQTIKDALDMTSIATYNSISSSAASLNNITYNNSSLNDTYRHYLAQNLKLNDDLTPKPNSIAQGTVTINSLNAYTGGFPFTCPNGNEINKLSIHVVITIPLKPNLYQEVILDLLGRDYIDLKVHQDTEMPVNN